MNIDPLVRDVRKTCFPKVHRCSHKKSTVIHGKRVLSTGKMDVRIGRYANVRMKGNSWNDGRLFGKRNTLHHISIYSIDCFFCFCLHLHLPNPSTKHLPIRTSSHPPIRIFTYLLSTHHPYCHTLSFSLPNPPKTAPDSGFPHFVYNSFCPIFAILKITEHHHLCHLSRKSETSMPV